jgi:O-antigen/teichoic acid export membrane protein
VRPLAPIKGGRVAALLRDRLPRGSVVLADQASVSAGNFASGLIAARALSTEGFALYVLANVAIWFAVEVQRGLILQPLVIEGAPLEDEPFRRLLRAYAKLQLIYLAGAFGLILLAGLAWEPTRAVALPLAAAAAGLQAQEFCRRALYTRGRSTAALLNNLVNYDLQALVLFLLASAGLLEIDRALWVMAATSLCAAVLGALQLRAPVVGQSDTVSTVFRRSTRVGLWGGLAAAAAYATIGAQPLLVSAVLGLPAAAAMGVVRQVMGPAHLILRPLDNHYLPRMSRALAGEGSSADRVLWRAVLVSAPAFGLYVLAVVAAPAAAVEWVFGSRYAEYADVLRLFALCELMHLPRAILLLEVQARRLQRFAFLGELWSALAIFALGPPLMLRLGLAGAAASAGLALGGQAAVCLVLVVLARRARPERACIASA